MEILRSQWSSSSEKNSNLLLPTSLFKSCLLLVSLNLLLSNSILVLCLDTKYFKRFYFGNLSVDLTEELGERFNYDYLPPSNPIRTPLQQQQQPSSPQQNNNAYHVHASKSNPHHHPSNAYNNEAHHPHLINPQRSSSMQADQPVQNGTVTPTPKTTAPPPPSSNQPYRHQDLKALSRNITNILNSFNISYDKRVRPNYGGEAVEVGITMFVLSISDLSEVEMDFTLDFYFRQMWKDHRLTFQGPKGVNTLSVSSEFLKSMWVPDTFFVNEKTSYFHTATTNNEFLRISQTGDILRSMRLTVCASCPMDLRHFPMDSQLCNIEIESFGYTMSDIRYKWAAGAGSVGMANDVSLPQFKVYGYRQKTYEISLSTGNYSRLACEIQFVRSMGYYLIQIYIPSSLIVVISWVSFWLNRNAAPARVYLGITTVLTMTTLMSSTNKALPKISYVKSIDVYLGTCFVMVFAALLEYATVGYLAKRIQMRKNHFAALQKMALQLQNAREEHVQKQYLPTTSATTPILPHAQQQQQHHHQQPTTPHHHAPSNPQTPHTPRYNPQQQQQQPDHHYHAQQTPSSTRFLESTSTSTLRKYTNNAQFLSSHHQQQSSSGGVVGAPPPPQHHTGIMGSTVSIPPGYYTPGAAPQNPQQQPRAVCYDSTGAPRYYDAQVYDQRGAPSGNAIQNTPHHHVHGSGYYAQQPQQQQQQPYYTSRDTSWGPEHIPTGTTSRGASVKRRGGGGGGGGNPMDAEMDPASRYMMQQQPIGLPGGQCIQQERAPAIYHHQAPQAPQQQQVQMQQTQVHVGSVIGTTSIEQAQPPQPPSGPGPTGDKIRQLIPINPNQICGITPSDIDKYSRVVFPVCFVCFNLLYWIIYLHISNVNPTPDLVIMNQEG